MSDIQPRFIRVSKAPAYLGMCRNVFNKDVRPHLREIPIGKQGKAFDRRELDDWANDYVERFSVDSTSTAGNDIEGNVERAYRRRNIKQWHAKQSQDSKCEEVPGTLIKRSKGSEEFAKALELAAAKKPRGI